MYIPIATALHQIIGKNGGRLILVQQHVRQGGNKISNDQSVATRDDKARLSWVEHSKIAYHTFFPIKITETIGKVKNDNAFTVVLIIMREISQILL